MPPVVLEEYLEHTHHHHHSHQDPRSMELEGNQSDDDGSCSTRSAEELHHQPQPRSNNKEKAKRRMSKVPVSRVSMIMRSCPNLTTVKNDAVALTSQAAELFIKDLILRTLDQAEDRRQITYNDLATTIADSDLTFLKDVIPQKMTIRDYLAMKASAEEGEDGGDEEGSEEEEE